MLVRIDFLRQDSSGGGSGNTCKIAAQLLTRLVCRLLDFSTGALDLTSLLLFGLGTRGINDFTRASIGAVENLGGALACFLDCLLGSLLGIRELTLAFLGGRDSIGDALAPRIHRAHQGAPEPALEKPYRDEKDHDLDDQGSGNGYHDIPSSDTSCKFPGAQAPPAALEAVLRKVLTNGFANRNHIATPNRMNGKDSMSPAKMNMFTISEPRISG